MAFVITVNMGGNAVPGAAAVAAGLNSATAAASQTTAAVNATAAATARAGTQARNAASQYTAGAQAAGAASAAAGNAAAAGGARAAAGHDAAKAAADGHGDSIQKLIHLAEAYFAIHQFETLVDGYIETSNRIRAVADDTQNLNGLMDATFAIAQHVRVAWEDVASTYQRLGTVTRGLGLSQQQVITLTEEMAMAAKVGGATNREAGASMAELTHAFSTGALQGREFRVLMRDTPSLMHELQVASGKTGGEFAEMGKKGHITADLLIEWFGKAGPAITEKFGRTLPTISEGFTLIKNAAEKFFGSAAVGSGVMGALSAAMRFVADHFEAFGKAVLGVGEALIGLFVIEKIIVMVKALTLAIAANPIGLLLTGVVVGISLLRQFGDELNTNEKIWTNVDNQFVTVGDHLRALWSMIKDLGAAILEFTGTAWHALMAAFSGGIDSSGIEFSLRNVLTLIASFVDAAIGLFKFMGHSLVTVFGGIPVALTEMLVDALRGVTSVIENAVNTVIGAVNKLIEAKNWINAKLQGEKTNAEQADAQRAFATKWADETNRKYQLGSYLPGPSGEAQGLGYTAQERAAIDARVREAQTAGVSLVRSGTGFPSAIAAGAPGGYGSDQVANLIKPVNLDFKTPWDGGANAVMKKFKEDWDNDIKGTDVTKDMVSSFMDELDKRARDEAAKRVRDTQAPGTVGTDHGAKEAHPLDEKALRALEKLKNELRAVTEAVNPQLAAIEKLSHAHEILGKAVAHHLISQEESVRLYDLYALKLEDQIHPFDAWIKKQTEATAALRDNSAEQERAQKLTAALDDLKQKQGGVVATQVEVELMTKRIALDQQHVEQLQAERQIMDGLTGPQHQYQTSLAAIGDLLERGRINADQYNHAVDNARAAYLAAIPGARTLAQLTESAWLEAKRNAEAAGVAVEGYGVVADRERAKQLAAGPEGKTFGGGLESSWLKAKADAESFGATVAGVVVSDVDKLNESLVSMANGGAVSWSAMIDSMIQDLERLILKQLEVAAINYITSGYGGAAAGVAGAAGGGSGGASGPITSPSQVSRTAPTAYGAPTTNSGASTSSNQQPVIVQVHNHYDKSVSIAANSSPTGQASILNVMRANQGTVRKFAGR